VIVARQTRPIDLCYCINLATSSKTSVNRDITTISFMILSEIILHRFLQYQGTTILS